LFEKATAKSIEDKVANEADRKRKRIECKARKDEGTASSARGRPVANKSKKVQLELLDSEDSISSSESDSAIRDGATLSPDDWVAVGYENGWYPDEFMLYVNITSVQKFLCH
jgi:hypothetical protein